MSINSNNKSNLNNLKTLLKEYKVKIPIMQRDYVHGLEQRIKEKFLYEIEKVIKGNQEELLLDFIYGSVDNGYLILVDGQQRITTLFLLYWYFAWKLGKLSEYNWLKNFTYETRLSSREFIEKLLTEIIKTTTLSETIKNQNWFSKKWNNNPKIKEILSKLEEEFKNQRSTEKLLDFLKIEKSKSKNEPNSYLIEFVEKLEKNLGELLKIIGELLKISYTIKNQPWFLEHWNQDPTIKAMLSMLDAIDERFKDDNKIERLDNIKFYFFDMKKFRLTDELYIKLNARGKLLTDFENLKAKFLEFLKSKNIDTTKISKKFDIDWTDFFWEYGKEKGKLPNDRVDNPFLNFIYFLSEMLYYLDNGDKGRFSEDYDEIIKVFEKGDHIDFLEFSLDKLQEVKDIFENIFSKKYKKNKIALFKDKYNIFNNCLYGKSDKEFDIFDKVLLFTIFRYLYKKNNKTVDQNNLKDLIRVVRNLLLSRRQLNAYQISYDSNLRYEDINKYLKSIEKLININSNIYNEMVNNEILKQNETFSDYLQKEKYKAEIIRNNNSSKDILFELEDHNYFKGILHNLPLNENMSLQELNNLKDKFYEIWGSLEDYEIIRFLLLFDADTNNYDKDFSIPIGKSGSGRRFLFGSKDNWHFVFTYDGNENNVKDVLKQLFEEFNNVKQFEERVKNKLKEFEKDKNYNWRYYFIKYADIFFEKFKDYKDNRNVFAWVEKWHKSFNSFKIVKMSGANLNARAINPFVYTVCKKLNNKEVSYKEHFEDWKPHYFKVKFKGDNFLEIECCNEGWKIYCKNYKNWEEIKKLIVDKTKDFLDIDTIEENKNDNPNLLIQTAKKDSSNGEETYIDKIDRINVMKELIGFLLQKKM